ncbi:MAG: DMT family transporter [Epulopiscium sp.]|nr:DMT family transporter [Candidatus Epulonipiscium sp.]
MESKKFFKNQYYVIAIAIFCSVLWGSAFPVLKVSYEEIGLGADDFYGKIVFAGMRFFLAAIFLFIIIQWVIKIPLKVDKKTFFELFILGMFQTALQYFFFYNGLAHTTGIKGSILGSIGTFFVVLFAHYIYQDDRMDIKKVIGLITGFGGIIIANLGKGGGQAFTLSFSFVGEGFMILSGLVSAWGTILAKKLAKDIHPFVVTGWQMFLGAIAMLLFGVTGSKSWMAFSFTPKAWILFIYSALLSAVAFALWYGLLKYNKAGEITLYRFMTPVSGSLLSAIFIPGETFTVGLLWGIILVSVGFLAVNGRKNNLKV